MRTCWVDPDLERRVLAAIYVARGRKDHLLKSLDPSDVCDPLLSVVYEAMASVVLRGGSIGQASLTVELSRRKLSPDDTLRGLEEACASSAGAEEYAQALAELSMRRRLAHLPVERLVAQASDARSAALAIQAEVEAIVRSKPPENTHRADALAREAYAALEAPKASRLRGLPTGLDRLDRVLRGMRPGGLYVAAARPGAGKTSLGLQVALEAVLRCEKACLVFSLEMTARELGDRMLAIEARVPAERIAEGRLEAEEPTRIHRTLSRLSESRLVVDDSAGLAIDDLTMRARRHHGDRALGLVVVDYLQLVRGSTRRKDSREQEVSEVARGLKNLAKVLDCPILALAQLNRQAEQRAASDRRPRLSDLRESGEIEQAADAVLGIHRPSQFDSAADPSLAEILVLKHRHGPTGIGSFTWRAEMTRFDDREEG